MERIELKLIQNEHGLVPIDGNFIYIIYCMDSIYNLKFRCYVGQTIRLVNRMMDHVQGRSRSTCYFPHKILVQVFRISHRAKLSTWEDFFKRERYLLKHFLKNKCFKDDKWGNKYRNLVNLFAQNSNSTIESIGNMDFYLLFNTLVFEWDVTNLDRFFTQYRKTYLGWKGL